MIKISKVYNKIEKRTYILLLVIAFNILLEEY